MFDETNLKCHDIRHNSIVSSNFLNQLKLAPNTVKYQHILFNTFVEYIGGNELTISESKKIKMTFWNNLYNPQWLEINFYTKDDAKILPNKKISLYLGQLHGENNVSSKEFEFIVESSENSKIEILCEIKSLERYSREYINLVWVVK